MRQSCPLVLLLKIVIKAWKENTNLSFDSNPVSCPPSSYAGLYLGYGVDKKMKQAFYQAYSSKLFECEMGAKFDSMKTSPLLISNIQFSLSFLNIAF